MRKAVYVISRLVTNPEHGVPVPNLGVHTSRDEAETHFERVIADRLKVGFTLVYRQSRAPTENPWVQRTAYFTRNYVRNVTYKDTETEELRLEVWRP